MTLTTRLRLPAFFVILTLLAWAAPAYATSDRASSKLPRKHHERASLTTQQRLDLFSPRVRKSTVMYLRLRLLELREQDLERARAAIERRLSIDDLLGAPRPTRF